MKLPTHLLLTTALLAPLVHAESGSGHGEDRSRPMGMGMSHGMNGGMPRHDCEEMEPCFGAGLDLSNEQQQKIRAIMEDARKKREALRDDTYNRIRTVLTPEQSRKLEEHRADILKHRAERMRERANRMDERARQLQGQPAPSGDSPQGSGKPR